LEQHSFRSGRIKKVINFLSVNPLNREELDFKLGMAPLTCATNLTLAVLAVVVDPVRRTFVRKTDRFGFGEEFAIRRRFYKSDNSNADTELAGKQFQIHRHNR
jgi:hypothetical protein